MKNRLRLLLIIYLFSFVGLFSQELVVKSFKLNERDLSARTEKRLDSNGNLCALIQVEAIPTCEFGGNIIGSVEKKLGAYWVYICAQNPTTRKLIVHSDHFQPLEVEFSNFGITPIVAGSTYTLKIETMDQADNISVNDEYTENLLLKSQDDLALSPFYNLKGDRVRINKCLKKLRTIWLTQYGYNTLTIEDADEWWKEKAKTKYVLHLLSLQPMGSFNFPMNSTKFERSKLKYSLTFEQYHKRPVTLVIYSSFGFRYLSIS
jgi:hypothetical protein